MKSKEINLKELGSIRGKTFELSKDLNKGIKKDEIIKEKIKKININPLINSQQISFLSESIINFISIGICCFIYRYFSLEWFNINEVENNPFYLGYFLVGGISLYVTGIFSWYEGKDLLKIKSRKGKQK